MIRECVPWLYLAYTASSTAGAAGQGCITARSAAAKMALVGGPVKVTGEDRDGAPIPQRLI
jgi:hypothetical protein